MRKRRTLSDLYRFPGCKPENAVHGIFGDPNARVIKLVRQGKKLLAGYAARFIEPIVPARSDWYVTSHPGTREFISNWKFGVFSVGGAAQ